MAPNLAPAQHDLIYDMNVDGSLQVRDMVYAAGCSERSVKAMRSNIHHFGRSRALPNGGGRPRALLSRMLEVLCEHLLEKPELYLEEMAVFL
jgi:hypothetical protein